MKRPRMTTDSFTYWQGVLHRWSYQLPTNSEMSFYRWTRSSPGSTTSTCYQLAPLSYFLIIFLKVNWYTTSLLLGFSHKSHFNCVLNSVLLPCLKVGQIPTVCTGWLFRNVFGDVFWIFIIILKRFYRPLIYCSINEEPTFYNFSFFLNHIRNFVRSLCCC